MDIGRKIYYNKNTGVCLVNTGDKSGSVYETTLQEDLETYPILKNSNIDFLILKHSERKEEFQNEGSVKVNPETKEITIYPQLTISTDKINNQITADTVDTIAITVTTQDDCIVTFKVDNGTSYEVATINKIATFPFATDIVGTHIIEASNNLYGTNLVQLEAI